MDDLPIVESCDGCGACCMEQTTPPGFAGYAVGSYTWPDECDLELWESAPEDAKQLVRDRMAIIKTIRGEIPCCWLDQETRKCRFYDSRPMICRESLERGDEGCHFWRGEYWAK